MATKARGQIRSYDGSILIKMVAGSLGIERKRLGQEGRGDYGAGDLSDLDPGAGHQSHLDSGAGNQFNECSGACDQADLGSGVGDRANLESGRPG